MKLKKIMQKLRNNPYGRFCQNPIKEFSILLEAGQGKNLNGNMFAMVREICENPAYQKYEAIFVVTANNEEEAKQRFSFYGYKVITVVRDSDKYKEYLATCKYLLTDNSFPPYFMKREGQIYLNTWHGTPLKTLGKSDIKNAKSLANIQKNYLMSDYALFPNEFTEDVFMKDYMLENLYQGKIVLCDYPRNRALLPEHNTSLRTKLGLDDVQLIAYMPTWRGTSRKADAEIQKKILHKYFLKIDKKLSDDQIFYVNLHFLLGNTMEFTAYKHIKPFPSEYETYDFLGICDMLVTDYSSVFFDFSVSAKKTILFTYDLEEYMRDRGTYFPVEELPFPIVRNVDDLIREINNEEQFIIPESFLTKYCNYTNPQVPEKLLELLINGDYSELVVLDAPNNKKETLLIYGGDFKNKKLNEQLLLHLQTAVQENPDKNCVLCFRGTINKGKVEFLSRLPEGVDYMALVFRFEFTVIDHIKAILAARSMFFSKLFDKKLQQSYENEKNRLYYHINPDEVQYYAGNVQYMYKVLGTFPCEKTAFIHSKYVMGLMCKNKNYQVMKNYFSLYYDKVIDQQEADAHALWGEGEQQNYYNKVLRMGNIFPHMKNTQQGLRLSSFAIIETLMPQLITDINIGVDECIYPSHIKRFFSVGNGKYLVHYSFVIPYQDVKLLRIQNKVRMVYEDERGYGLSAGIKYDMYRGKKRKNLYGPVHVFEKSNTAAHFRQNARNLIYFTVRRTNVTDKPKEQYKLFFAYYLAKIFPKKGIIILFEKESERYEESASVLYEKLIDHGYKNAYFVLSADYDHMDSVPEKYRSNIIYKGTFKHYLYFFKSKTFLGSETLVHAIDLRVLNKYAQKKLKDNTLDYVFLQHGVMYMVSLDSEARRFFKKMKTKGKYRVVVSSEKEARHFIELGGYMPEMIYTSGLPKYDRNVLNEDADKIVIMLTWRPWEYNDARYNFAETKYYQMLYRIFKAIPEKYHSRIIILPHPLFYDAVQGADFELKRYLNNDAKYDDILKQAKVLITDYSSIAYDAFYRGSNVLFYWEEKDECMGNYGPSTKLMLNHDNIFGKICYNANELSAVIGDAYDSPQDPLFQKRYGELVQFHDGNNTERLIKFLEEDEII